MQSVKISDNLYLVRRPVETKASAPPEAPPIDHIVVIDCSGSMYYDLPQVREQLKKKIPKIMREGDTLSIIWFSGRGQFGTLLEGEPVATLTDLQTVNAAIDRWLRPIGLTGFREPMEEVGEVIRRLSKSANGHAYNLIFMSDGYDNQWNRQEILEAVSTVADDFSAATFVEYGYYADRNMLSKMAEKAGGNLIFAENFDRYAPAVEDLLKKKVTGAPRVSVPIGGDPIGGFVFAMHEGELLTFSAEGGEAVVNAEIPGVYYLSPQPVGSDNGIPSEIGVVYAALSLFAQRMQPKVIWPLLKCTGDIRFIEDFGTCFGKQAYSDFVEATKEAAFDGRARVTQGFDRNRVPREDAFTILELLTVLCGDDDNRILLDHSDFKYSRIGRKRVDSNSVLTQEEQNEVKRLTEELTSTKDPKKVKEISDKIAAISDKPEPLKFEAEEKPNGYPISALTYNEDRPNISFRIQKFGTVDLSGRIPDNLKGKVPEKIETCIHRNYAIIKDGLINIDRLPVRLTAGTLKTLMREGGLPWEAVLNPTGETLEQTHTRVKKAGKDRPVTVVLNLRAIPIINQKMIQECSAKTLFETKYRLIKTQAEQKVYNTIRKEVAPKVSKGFALDFGEEAAAWLKEQGITDYSGFSPKSVQADSTDFYMGKELTVKVKGLSKLPSLKEAREKIASGKVNPPTALMKPHIDEADKALQKKGADDFDLEKWVTEKQEEAVQKCRSLIMDIAQTTFAVIVGQTWFTEFSSLDENSMEIEVDDTRVHCTAELKEVQVKV